jgi:23S rRNA pseudouridine1911/1915/1917 synthase
VKAPIHFTVTPEEAGQRLDLLIIEHATGLSRRRARALFEAGAVRVGTRPGTRGEPGRAGDQVSVAVDPSAAQVTPEPGAPLRVCLETSDLLVVDKPAGQPTAPLVAGERGTLAGALVGHYPDLAGVGFGPREPGLLHRLDTHTSGLLLVARRASVFDALREAFRAGSLVKRYLAVVAPAPGDDTGVITLPLAPHPTDARRVVVTSPDRAARAARSATTRWRVVARSLAGALLELEVSRAYRHQIRVHLAAGGTPIVGDRIYAGTMVLDLGARHALHASHLSWAGHAELPGFAVDSALPDELSRLLLPTAPIR